PFGRRYSGHDIAKPAPQRTFLSPIIARLSGDGFPGFSEVPLVVLDNVFQEFFQGHFASPDHHSGSLPGRLIHLPQALDQSLAEGYELAEDLVRILRAVVVFQGPHHDIRVVELWMLAPDDLHDPVVDHVFPIAQEAKDLNDAPAPILTRLLKRFPRT